MNFAKNTVCLQCDAKRPKRQLLPGEWECPECNFLNYRRNMACFHCECKRPADASVERMTEERHGMPSRREKVVNREDVANAWNFDFDDDESDGADVAAFEYADSTRMNKDTPMGDFADEGRVRGYDDSINNSRGSQRFNMRESHDDRRSNRPGDGFNDFDDEDDDIDSYEIDTNRDGNLQRASASSYNFSEAGEFSEPEDSNQHSGREMRSKFQNKPTYRKQPVFSDDDELGFDTDEEASTTPKWKSSHVSSGHSKRSRVPTKKLSFGSDEEFGLDSDMDDDDNDDGGRFGRGKRSNSRGGVKGKGRSFLASDDDDGGDDDLYSARKGSRGNRRETTRASYGGSRQRSNSFDSGDTNRRSRGGHGQDRRSQPDDNKRWGQRNSSERSNKRGGFGERRYEKDRKEMDTDYGEFRNSRRVIER